MFHRRSTASRRNRRSGPRSRSWRYFSSPRIIPSRIFARCSRILRFSSGDFPLVLPATSGRRLAASASRRLGVGRPLPWGRDGSTAGSTVVVVGAAVSVVFFPNSTAPVYAAAPPAPARRRCAA